MDEERTARADEAVAQYATDVGTDAEAYIALLDATCRSAQQYLGHQEAARLAAQAGTLQVARGMVIEAALIARGG